MKIKEGFVLRKIAEEHVIIPSGERIIDFNGLIRLNDTAVFIWNMLTEGSENSEIIKTLTEEYEIDAETATADVHELLETLQKKNLLDYE